MDVKQPTGEPHPNVPAEESSIKNLTPPARSHELLNVLQDDSRLYITLQSHTNRNALSRELLRDLYTALEGPFDEAVRSIVIAAEGNTFSSGHDFEELHDISEQEATTLFEYSADLMKRIRSLELPVIAQVGGGAVGAGCQLALACDFVVASSDAFFQTPGGAKGWFCFTPMVELMEHLPSKRALEMLMTGEPISAEKAYGWGLINRLVAPEELEKATVEFTSRITQGNAEMLGLGKATFYQNLNKPQAEKYKDAVHKMSETAPRSSAQERVRKFMNRKKS